MSEKYTNLNGVSLSDSYADFIESVGIISVKEIYGKYKIHHDKTRRAVRSGFLNAVHTDSGKKCQYFIIRDELYHAFIEKHCTKRHAAEKTRRSSKSTRARRKFYETDRRG